MLNHEKNNILKVDIESIIRTKTPAVANVSNPSKKMFYQSSLAWPAHLRVYANYMQV